MVEFMQYALLRSVEKRLHYSFKDRELLLLALTHSSYANEHLHVEKHNERLEFLGDAVLELSISEELYQRYPEVPEGSLTSMRSQLVSEPALAVLGRQLDIAPALFLGKGEESQGGRDRDAVLCDVMEAIFGAIFLDSSYAEAKSCILRLYADKWPEAPTDHGHERLRDFKSRLQECTQQTFKERPVYYLEDSTGPEHAKIYHVRVELPNGEQATAADSSVKKAEQQAARKALEYLRG